MDRPESEDRRGDEFEDLEDLDDDDDDDDDGDDRTLPTMIPPMIWLALKRDRNHSNWFADVIPLIG